MAAEESWTIDALADALAGFDGEFAVARVEGDAPALRVTVPHQGDLAIFVGISGPQLVASTLLWPVDEQADAAAFNAFLLRAQKHVPLSNFAITEVDGREWYELMGELAAASPVEMVALELRVLADNAISAAADLRAAFAA